jgi:thiol:disulfide interchange protein DsbD
MGAALGFALTQPAVTTFLVFAFLGLGMAAPYVAFSLAPWWVQRLPSPGPWMETLRQALAFPLFATSVWLVWVYGNQTGTDGTAYLVLALLLLGFSAWIVGRWNRLTVSRRTYVVTRAFAVSGILAAVLCVLRSSAQPQGTAESDVLWQPWSPAAVTEHQTAGRSVFVDFTADWCLTCKVNERVVLATNEIESAFEQYEVALLKADWTRRDSAISQALESFGVGGVPLYVLYPGDPTEPPRVLPVILTKSIVLDALENL